MHRVFYVFKGNLRRRFIAGLISIVCGLSLPVSTLHAESREGLEKVQLEPQLEVRGWYDIDPQVYRELQPHWHVVPEQDNASSLLLRAQELMEDRGELREEVRAYETGEKAWDSEYFQKALEKNSAVIQLIEEIAEKKYFQPIEMPDSVDASFDEGFSLLQCMTFLKAQFYQSLEAGQLDACMAWLERVNRISTMVSEADGSLVSWLIGIALEKQTLLMMDRLIDHDLCQQEQLAVLQRWLQNRPDVDNRFEEAMRYEMMIASQIITTLYRSPGEMNTYVFVGEDPSLLESVAMLVAGLTSKIVFQPNQTIDMIAQLRMYDIQRSKLPRWKRAEVEKPQCYDLVNEELPIFSPLSLNWYGVRLLRFSSSLIHKQLDKKDDRDARYALIQLKCQLKSHYLQKKKLPESLSDLFEQVPLDSFDGKPIRYSQRHRILWSVGLDGKDEGGLKKVARRVDENLQKDEPTVHLGFISE